jgi:para-nitrobenzyl esterase
MIVPERPVVGTESGSVRGTVEDSVAAFRGIPYAASPVGGRRFAVPEPHPAWTGPRDAARPGPSVPQGPSRLEAVMGTRTPDWDEDGCLTLNVWTPHRPAGGAALPVLVWFHGGGFTSGSGGWDWYDGRNLAAAGDIVVVTANYRIGPLGFLYLPELGIENLGVQDQAAVLGWVERNIAAFGGDPGAVTVGGQSAGAFSALYLALSPVTGQHVSRVIAQSGPWGLPPQHPGEAADHAGRFLKILGLAGRADLSSALRAVPLGQILAAYRQLAQDTFRPGSAAPPMYPVLGVFVYRFDYTPVPDPAHLGAAHCSDLPFFFDTIDAYPGSLMLGEATAAVRALGRTVSRAVAGFVATGRPAADRWPPYEPADQDTVRHFA